MLFHEEGHSPLFLNASRVKLISRLKAPVKVTTSCVHDHNSLIPFSSVVVTESHEQLISLVGTDLGFISPATFQEVIRSAIYHRILAPLA